MMLVDTNVMIYAHRRDAERHKEYRDWMRSMINGPEPYAVSDFAVSGMIRVVTNRRVYREDASTTEEALTYAAEIRNQPHATVVNPGARFWPIFTRLCRQVGAWGKLVPDAYLAALAIEHGCEFVTEDRDFGRFQGLRWRHPLGR
ncbi:MAG: type II toxin-antitoxin system VapC family toxin [Streptosporangiaceae bacterium]|nr:type II toxin-antitoxin system VapC family toxin [Streptosporangiaceae bacterium]MBV9854651.1 type II toxin-antitoxin system VapC family toxin [Streptosporangiaceae bacterium]